MALVLYFPRTPPAKVADMFPDSIIVGGGGTAMAAGQARLVLQYYRRIFIMVLS